MRSIFSLLFLLVYTFSYAKEVPQKHKYQLAICAIFQNDAPYLKEWIEFHKIVGVEHFYLYNNLSEDNYEAVLAPYVESGDVELMQWEHASHSRYDWINIQCAAYLDRIKRAKGECKWIAFIDTDEFLFAVETNNLLELLPEYERFGALCVNWQMFGTSKVAKIPEDKLLIETLTRRAPTNWPRNFAVKSIVQIDYVEPIVQSPHYFCTKRGYPQVTSEKLPFRGPYSPSVDVKKIRINHYWSRDEDFFNREKVPRYKKWNNNGYPELNSVIEILNKEQDTQILRFVNRLRDHVFNSF